MTGKSDRFGRATPRFGGVSGIRREGFIPTRGVSQLIYIVKVYYCAFYLIWAETLPA